MFYNEHVGNERMKKKNECGSYMKTHLEATDKDEETTISSPFETKLITIIFTNEYTIWFQGGALEVGELEDPCCPT